MPVDFETSGPPRDPTHKYDWSNITRRLRNRPKDWGIVRPETGGDTTYGAARQVAFRIKTGRIPGAVKGEFEAAVRDTTIYARYVGNDN